MEHLAVILLGALLAAAPGIDLDMSLPLDDKMVACETAAIERDRKDKSGLIEECGVEPAIYDRAVINTKAGNLYHFRVNTHPIGICDSSYIVKETRFGMKRVFEYEPSERNRYNIYDGGFVQNIGESSATASDEELYDISDSVKRIYMFDQDDIRYYVDYGEIWCLKGEATPLNYLEEDDLRNICVYQVMIIDDIRVWCLLFFNGTDSGVIDSVNNKILQAELPENTVFCKNREEYKKVCKALLKEKGFDVDKFFSTEPLLGEIESEMWDLRYKRFD